MALIDEQGRLFGRINIIDAFTILVVIAIVVAGLSFALAADDQSTPSGTRYATIDFGTQPNYVATLVSEGDTATGPNGANVTITDVYSTASGSDRRIRARVRITAPIDGGTVNYNSAPLRVGRSIEIQTDAYTIEGTLTAVDNTSPDLSLTNTDVLLRTTLPTEIVSELEHDQTFRVDGRRVAKIQSVNAYRAGGGNATVLVGVTYLTYRSPDGPQFGETVVQRGAKLPFETDRYAFEGEVIRRGSLTPPGTEATRTVSLKMEQVDPELASSLRTGLTEQFRGETVARLTDVEVQPTTIILTSQDGNIYQRRHPLQKDVTMTAELRVRETDTGVRFKGSALQQGETVVLNLGIITIEATVVSV